jgi:predicted transcriptional regulator of viral defense system
MLSTKAKILAALEKNKVMRVSDLSKYLTHRSLLRRMDEAGEIFSVGSGFYAHPSMDPQVAAVVVTKYYPKAVVSGITAMVIHGLSDEVIDRVDIDIPRTSSIRNKLFRVHRVPEKRLIGIVNHPYQGYTVRTYDKERTLCDAYLVDPQGALFFRALKRYVRGHKHPNTTSIGNYDKILKTKVVAHLRQELADG